jgi:hypothetical protein
MGRTHDWTSTRQSILVAVFLANFVFFLIKSDKFYDSMAREKIKR